MSSESWFGHQSRLVRPRREREAAGSFPGSLSGSPVLASMSISFGGSSLAGALGAALHRRKRFNFISENGKIDQATGLREGVLSQRHCCYILTSAEGERAMRPAGFPAALIALAATAGLGGAALAAHRPALSWGKPGISFETYRADATACLRAAAATDLTGTEPAEALILGSRRVAMAQNF